MLIKSTHIDTPSDKWIITLLIVLIVITLIVVATEHIITAFMCLSVMGYLFGQLHWSDYKEDPIHLSDVPIEIKVQGQKVVIPNLPDGYRYKDLAGHSRPDNSEHIFKFDYDEIFEAGTLTDRDGRKYELDKDDSQYLKERTDK